MEMTKVHLSPERSTPAHKFSALRIEETVWEILFSNLLLCEMDSCLLLMHLTCVFLSVATGHLSSQHGPCVMAAFSPLRFLAAWRVEAPFFRVSLLDVRYNLRSLWLAA